MHSKNRFKMYIFVVYELSNNAWSVEHVFDDLLAVLPLQFIGAKIRLGEGCDEKAGKVV